ncbi:DUF7518 family protein [Halohasta salina]|uniref:DUF7518 family protein n=1 Tax=Halohasta salina TaxID=2961621 RepID=UPI0020A5F29B|nr:chromosome segregation protein SMC [Halohasta salina]
MTNRVDELESEIAELRAAVNGLTEELVETKARVRELEDAAEADEAAEDGFVEADPVDANETTKSDDHVEVVEQEPSDETGASSFEADNTDESEASTDDETAESGDIIIA